MNIEELEEILEDILPIGFRIEADDHGQLIIFTGLTKDDDGDLVDFESEEDEELNVDSGFELLEDEEEQEE